MQQFDLFEHTHQQPEQKSSTGLRNFLAGHAAENAVERLYLDKGCRLCARRWRGGGGELDLILEGDSGLVFVEVKKARTHDQAAARISKAQIQRIFTAATVFVAQKGIDPFVNMEFDVALVNEIGEIQVLENAMMGV